MTTLQKIIKYLAIAFALFLIISIIGGIVSATSLFSFLFDKAEITDDMTKTAVTTQISELDIEISAAEFTIVTANEFSVSSNIKDLKVKENNGKLEITENIKIGKAVNGMKIELSIPEGTVFKKAEIDTGAGYAKFDTVTADKIDIDLGAGKAEIKNLTATDSADIDGGAGQLIIEDGLLSNLDFDMGIGEAIITSKLTGICEIDQGIGKAQLNILGNKNDYSVTVNKGLGNASIDGVSVSDGSITGNGTNKVTVNGGMGEIEINFK